MLQSHLTISMQNVNTMYNTSQIFVTWILPDLFLGFFFFFSFRIETWETASAKKTWHFVIDIDLCLHLFGE